MKHSVKRNIKKNILRYDKTSLDAVGMADLIVCRVLIVLFAVLLPFFAIFASVNVAVRIPDVYSFDLSRTMIISESKINAEDSEISGLISHYMMHKTDRFQLSQKDKFSEAETPIFSPDDAINLSKYRKAADLLVYIAIAAFVICVLAFAYLMITKRKRSLRRGLFAGLIVYIGSLIGIVLSLYDKATRTSIMYDVLGISYSKHDVLPKFFGAGLRTEMLIVSGVISLLIILVVYYLVMHFTKGYTLFKKGQNPDTVSLV
jgi:hypothetical protein